MRRHFLRGHVKAFALFVSMTMTTVTTRWTTQEAYIIVEFLDELREAIWAQYEEELLDWYGLEAHRQEQEPVEEGSSRMDFDDAIPF